MVPKHSFIKKTWLVTKYNVVGGLNLLVDISSPSVNREITHFQNIKSMQEKKTQLV